MVDLIWYTSYLYNHNPVGKKTMKCFKNTRNLWILMCCWVSCWRTSIGTNQFMHTNSKHFREDIFMAREVTLADIKFEQASVLYNIGALHSILGSMETRTNADVNSWLKLHVQFFVGITCELSAVEIPVSFNHVLFYRVWRWPAHTFSVPRGPLNISETTLDRPWWASTFRTSCWRFMSIWCW